MRSGPLLTNQVLLTPLVALITQIVHGRTSSGGSLCLADRVHACSAHKLGPARKQAPALVGKHRLRAAWEAATPGALRPCRAEPRPNAYPRYLPVRSVHGGQRAGPHKRPPGVLRPTFVVHDDASALARDFAQAFLVGPRAQRCCRPQLHPIPTALAAMHPASPSRAAILGRNRQVQM